MNTTQAKHTPGPWTVDVNGERFDVLCFTPGKCPDGVDDIGNVPIPANVANAHLIAAAPELLEALKMLVKADTAICENIGLKSDQAMQRIAALDMAKAAIAKAEGRGE